MPVKKRPPKILRPVGTTNLDLVKVRKAVLAVRAARLARERQAQPRTR